MSSSPFTHLFTEELYQPTQGVIVVLSRKWEDYSFDDKLTLAKMLTSIRLSIEKVQVISSPAITIESLTNYTPSQVLIFGSEAPGMKTYEIVEAPGFSVLKADDLSELDPARKQRLWQALKKMFEV